MNGGHMAQRRQGIAIGSGGLMLLLAGLLYAWSIFVTPLEAEFGWQRAQTSLTYTICVTCNTLCALLAARLSGKIGSRWVVRLAALGVLVGFLLASRTQRLWQLYVSYGALCAGGLGMIYNVVLSAAAHWSSARPGTVSGAMLMCYGLGAMVFGSLVSRLIETSGWRAAFAAMGLICFAAMLAGSFFVDRAAADKAPLPSSVPAAEPGQRELSPVQMLHETSFWLYALWTLVLATIGLILTSHAAPIAQEVGTGARAAALYVGAVSVSNGLSRLVFGVVFDRLGRRATMLIISCIGVAGGVALWLAFGWRSKAVLLLAFLLLGAAFGGTPVSSANFIQSMYGAKNYAKNLAVGNLSVLVAAYIGPYAAGLVYQNAGYRLVLIAVLLLGAVGVLLSVALYRRRETKTFHACIGCKNYEKG